MTVTVSVIDEVDTPREHPCARRGPEDFRLEWYSGSGAGGQHRNRHRNSARLRHLPTGLVVTAQERKRPASEALARAKMTERLDAALRASGHAAVNDSRAGQIGSGAKADKRRTYRFQDGRVIDHETGRSAPTGKVMKGELDRLW